MEPALALTRNKVCGFSMPTGRIVIGPQEVHIWIYSLVRSSDERRRIDSFIASTERLASERFHFAHDRANFVAARAVTRWILSLYTGSHPADLRFELGRMGKPSLAGTAFPQFNLSHSGDQAILAVTRNSPVGVDLEKVRRDFDLLNVAAIAFSFNEQAALHGLPPDLQQAGFFKCWTSKEAYLKAFGFGLSPHSRDFDVSVDPRTPANLLSDRIGSAESFSLYDLDAGAGYAATVATNLLRPQFVFRDLSSHTVEESANTVSVSRSTRVSA